MTTYDKVTELHNALIEQQNLITKLQESLETWLVELERGQNAR